MKGSRPDPRHNGAQCWMQCGTGLVKMFKRSMLLRHRDDPSTIMPRHRTAYQLHNAKKPLTAQTRRV